MEKPSIQITLTHVSPEKAKQWIDLSGGNRKIRERRVHCYARDMKNGKWHFTHQGFAFNADGQLVDGHHRAYAIMASGVSIWALVVRGLTKDACIALDGGLPRSAKDAMFIAGKGNYQDDLISVARVFSLLPETAKCGRDQMSVDEVECVIEEHAEALSFACQATKGVDGASRGSRCLIARAYYHCDRERLSEFCEVLKSGMPVQGEIDSAAIVYSRFLIRTKRHGSTMEEERYRKGQTCLMAFMERKPMEKVYGTNADLFPIPNLAEEKFL